MNPPAPFEPSPEADAEHRGWTRRQWLSSTLGAASLPMLPNWKLIEPDRRDPQGPEPSTRVAAFERMAFGMFLHYGLYSQIGAGEWAMNRQKIPRDRYLEQMRTFTAADFDGAELARAAKRAGMRYITLTSRHHDGFSLYDTRGLSPWDVTKTPARRDLIANFVEGCRAEGIVPMLYCTTLDWSDPRFASKQPSDWLAYQRYLRDSIELLCTQYGSIGGFWFDGNWAKPKADWQLDQLYGLIRKHQPEALIINNTGLHAGGKVGHPEVDSVTFERGRPQPLDRSGMKKYVTAEMCHTFNFHWGIAERDFNYLSPAHVIEELVSCRRAGANLLMNVGPTASGALPDYERAALARVGDWIALHGGKEPDGLLYAGRPAGITGSGRDFGLRWRDELYLFVFDLTHTANSKVGGAAKARGPGPREFEGIALEWKHARWLDSGQQLRLERSGDALVLHATGYPYGTNTVVRVAQLSRGE